MRPPQIPFPALLQSFFQQRLIAQRGASAQTVMSYRDTFELLLRYAEQATRHPPSALTLEDLDAPLVLAFLDHLEAKRGNCPRTRNLRLTAIRSFMRYASVREPAALPVAQRVLAIPSKRFDRPALEFLSREEMSALLDAPDRATWSGQRDAVLLATLMGYYLGWLCSATGNLLVPIVVHWLYDTLALWLLRREFQKDDGAPRTPEGDGG